MTGELLVVGGRQREPRALRHGQQNWAGYDRGLVLAVDPATGAIRVRMSYAPPAERVVNEVAISFQAATLEHGRLYLATENEVLVVATDRFEIEHRVSHPWFNDVHHVVPVDGGLLVASAGLELVLDLTLEGEVRHVWHALGEEPWAVRDPEVDWRLVASTKPHRAHPNFVFRLGEEVWCTRFQQGDAVCVQDPRRRVQVSEERIHDGVVADGRIHFTTVHGQVVIVDAQTLEVLERLDLPTLHGDRRQLRGWCRGVLPAAGGLLWVGFSRIRPTRFRENVGWVSRGFRRDSPTHIACYDPQTRTCVAEVDLEAAGLGAVYSVLATA